MPPHTHTHQAPGRAFILLKELGPEGGTAFQRGGMMEASGPKEQREQEEKQKTQGWLGNTELSSWAALDTGNEAKAKALNSPLHSLWGPTKRH